MPSSPARRRTPFDEDLSNFHASACAAFVDRTALQFEGVARIAGWIGSGHRPILTQRTAEFRQSSRAAEGPPTSSSVEQPALQDWSRKVPESESPLAGNRAHHRSGAGLVDERSVLDGIDARRDGVRDGVRATSSPPNTRSVADRGEPCQEGGARRLAPCDLTRRPLRGIFAAGPGS